MCAACVENFLVQLSLVDGSMSLKIGVGECSSGQLPLPADMRLAVQGLIT